MRELSDVGDVSASDAAGCSSDCRAYSCDSSNMLRGRWACRSVGRRTTSAGSVVRGTAIEYDRASAVSGAGAGRGWSPSIERL